MVASNHSTWLPEGWDYTPTRKASSPKTKGDRLPDVPGTLRRRADGRTWPLIGNSSASQERKMVEAIIDANPVPAC